MMAWHVYLKEMKDALRDRKTIILSVMLPILFNIAIIFFMDKVMMNETVEEVKAAVSQTADTEVIDWIEQAEGVTVVKAKDPVQSVKDGETVVGIEVPADFMEKLHNGQSPEIVIYADQSSQKASTGSEQISMVLNMKKQEELMKRLAEKNIDPASLEPFHIKTDSVGGEDEFSLYMISIFAQLVIVLAVLMGGMSAANDLFAGEKERKTMEALIMTPVSRLQLIIGKWLTISTLGIISGIFSVVTFTVVVIFFTEHLGEAMNLKENFGIFTLGLGVGIFFFALLVATLEMIISLTANTMKEAQNYVSPLTFVAMLPYFILMRVSANELTAKHFLIPFLNINALIKQLIYGVYDVKNILFVALSSAFFIAIAFAVAVGMFRKSKWVLGK